MTVYALLVYVCNPKSLQFSVLPVRFCFVELFVLTNTINPSYPLKG